MSIPKYEIGDIVLFKSSVKNSTLRPFIGQTGEVVAISKLNNPIYQLKGFTGWFAEDSFVGRYEVE